MSKVKFALLFGLFVIVLVLEVLYPSDTFARIEQSIGGGVLEIDIKKKKAMLICNGLVFSGADDWIVEKYGKNKVVISHYSWHGFGYLIDMEFEEVHNVSVDKKGKFKEGKSRGALIEIGMVIEENSTGEPVSLRLKFDDLIIHYNHGNRSIRIKDKKFSTGLIWAYAKEDNYYNVERTFKALKKKDGYHLSHKDWDNGTVLVVSDFDPAKFVKVDKKKKVDKKQDQKKQSSSKKILNSSGTAEKGSRSQSSNTASNANMELEFWNSIKDSTDADDFKAYITQYPKGSFVALAKSKSKQYKKQKEASLNKETLVLMPIKVSKSVKGYKSSMENALVKGLNDNYKVFSGSEVKKKVQEVYTKESRKTKAGMKCDETKCIQDVAISFQSELVAIASVVQNNSGYIITLNIKNIFDNASVLSETLPCKGCDEFQVIEKLKLISN